LTNNNSKRKLKRLTNINRFLSIIKMQKIQMQIINQKIEIEFDNIFVYIDVNINKEFNK